jgi:predicted nucleotidyltransferase
MQGTDVPTLEDLRRRRTEIERIATRRGARNIRVFGSVARGDANAESDIDFLVEFESGRNVLDLSELILDLEEALGRRVDVVEIFRPSPLADHIRSQAIPL